MWSKLMHHRRLYGSVAPDVSMWQIPARSRSRCRGRPRAVSMRARCLVQGELCVVVHREEARNVVVVIKVTRSVAHVKLPFSA
jgi:hypothetical protein